MKDDKSVSNSIRADKALHLIAATVLCGAVLNAPIEALSLQSSVSADVVSQSSKSRQILTKYLQEKHKQKAKIDKQKFLEAIKEQQEAKGQTSRTDGHTGKTIKLNQHDMAEMTSICTFPKKESIISCVVVST